MIKYSLNCGDCTNNFEGWFPSSKGFAKQKKDGHLLCPFCDSGNVDKAIMSPNITKKSTQKKTVASTNSEDYSSNDIMMAGQAKSVLRRMSKYVEKNFEIGDIALFYCSLKHGVKKISSKKKIGSRWWMCLTNPISDEVSKRTVQTPI